MENNVKKNIEKIKNFDANLARENQQTEHKSAEIIQFRQKITQFELTKAIYESEIFSEIKLTFSITILEYEQCIFSLSKCFIFSGRHLFDKSEFLL